MHNYLFNILNKIKLNLTYVDSEIQFFTIRHTIYIISLRRIYQSTIFNTFFNKFKFFDFYFVK